MGTGRDLNIQGSLQDCVLTVVLSVVHIGNIATTNFDRSDNLWHQAKCLLSVQSMLMLPRDVRLLQHGKGMYELFWRPRDGIKRHTTLAIRRWIVLSPISNVFLARPVGQLDPTVEQRFRQCCYYGFSFGLD